MTSPLLITNDAALLDELQRLCAAVGVTPIIAQDAETALRAWQTASVVIVGVDSARELGGLAPQRRSGVHLVSIGPVADHVFRAALAVGAENVADLPRSEGWLVEVLSESADPDPSGGCTIGVIGGSGGAGATTLACALAQVAARSGPAVVIDTDTLGPGVDRVLGVDTIEGIRWEALWQTTGRFSGRALRESLPTRSHVSALTWGTGSQRQLQPFAVRDSLAAARRGFDTVVVDLPRSVDPLINEVVSRCDRVFVVAVPTVPGVAAAVRICARLGDPQRLRLVVRGSGISPEGIAQVAQVPLAAVMSDQRGLDESVDLGLGPVRSLRGPLGRTARLLLHELAAGERHGQRRAA